MDKTFDDIRRIDENGNEYWTARELQEVLQYSEWRNFVKVLNQSKISCKVSLQSIEDHFVEVTKMVEIGSGAKRKQADYKLSRYACYLIVMNADPRKEIVALGQTYFAVKTRQQELQEIYHLLSEDERRLYLRGDIRHKNILLAEAAHRAGIDLRIEYAIFQNAGYKGLYGGLTAEDIAVRKGLKDGDEILDYMGSAELGANLFRITQTEDILRKNNVADKDEATATHYKVGKAVRKTIEELGGTMPEDLPTPDKGIAQLLDETLKPELPKK